VCYSDRDDLTYCIAEGDFFADDCRKRKSAHEEHQDELKWSQLLARPSSYDADDKHEKEVSEERSNNRGHGIPDIWVRARMATRH
jgi:hypothetical protein